MTNFFGSNKKIQIDLYFTRVIWHNYIWYTTTGLYGWQSYDNKSVKLTQNKHAS